MRSEPRLFARECLERFRQRLVTKEDQLYYLTLDNTKALPCSNGLNMLEAAIRRLNSYKPLHPERFVRWSQDLSEAAEVHANDIGPKGLQSSLSTNGLPIYERLKRYPTLVPSMLTELMSFGSQNPCEALILMILSDANNLEALLNPIHQHFGFALARHKSDLGHFAVMPLCFEFLTQEQV